MSQYEIVEVKSGKDLKEFLNLSLKVFPDRNGLHVQPLNVVMKMQIGKLGTPQKHLFLAKKDGQAVARIGVKVHKHHKNEMLHFGFFECLEGHQLAAEVLVKGGRAVLIWLMRRVLSDG